MNTLRTALILSVCMSSCIHSMDDSLQWPPLQTSAAPASSDEKEVDALLSSLLGSPKKEDTAQNPFYLFASLLQPRPSANRPSLIPRSQPKAPPLIAQQNEEYVATIKQEVIKATARAFTMDMQLIEDMDACTFSVIEQFLKDHYSDGAFYHAELKEPYTKNLIDFIRKTHLVADNVASMSPVCTYEHIEYYVRLWHGDKTIGLQQDTASAIRSGIPLAKHIAHRAIEKYLQTREESPFEAKRRRYLIAHNEIETDPA